MEEDEDLATTIVALQEEFRELRRRWRRSTLEKHSSTFVFGTTAQATSVLLTSSRKHMRSARATLFALLYCQPSNIDHIIILSRSSTPFVLYAIITNCHVDTLQMVYSFTAQQYLEAKSDTHSHLTQRLTTNAFSTSKQGITLVRKSPVSSYGTHSPLPQHSHFDLRHLSVPPLLAWADTSLTGPTQTGL